MAAAAGERAGDIIILFRVAIEAIQGLSLSTGIQVRYYPAPPRQLERQGRPVPTPLPLALPGTGPGLGGHGSRQHSTGRPPGPLLRLRNLHHTVTEAVRPASLTSA